MSDVVVRVAHSEVEAPGITTVYFSHDTESLTRRFPAGSFGVFQVEGSSQPFKPYSISTSPDDHELGITVENVGPHSAELCSLQPGDRVSLQGPFGRFTLPEAVSTPIVFIAGGIGITPIRSLIRHLASQHGTLPVALLYSARSKTRLIFHDEFIALAERWPAFTYVPTITGAPEKGWEGRHGRLVAQDIREATQLPKQCRWYICGSQGFVQEIQALIAALGVELGAIQIEQWVRGRSRANLVYSAG
jgi:ferredoxin-NADP reductase